MYYFAAAQQTNAAKLPAFFQKFQTEERVLGVKNDHKISTFVSTVESSHQ